MQSPFLISTERAYEIEVATQGWTGATQGRIERRPKRARGRTNKWNGKTSASNRTWQINGRKNENVEARRIKDNQNARIKRIWALKGCSRRKTKSFKTAKSYWGTTSVGKVRSNREKESIRQIRVGIGIRKRKAKSIGNRKVTRDANPTTNSRIRRENKIT